MKILRYGNTNTYFLNGRAGSLLIDTDYAGTMPGFFRAVKAAGISVKDITYVIATHYHPDHMGIIGDLQQLGIRPVIVDVQQDSVHFSDDIFAREKHLSYTPIDENNAVRISCAESREFLHGIGISGEIIHTPSHSQDSISVVLDDGDCFAGDLEPIEYLAAYDNNPALQRDWDLMMSYNPKHIYYAHVNDKIFASDEKQAATDAAIERIRETEVNLDRIRGCFAGGAAGDALGYAIEFSGEDEIFSRYGKPGITEYETDRLAGKAIISDDTQMTLFTANGLLVGDTRGCMRGIQGRPRGYVAMAYQDWLKTQETSFEESRKEPGRLMRGSVSWLLDVPELYKRRAPGNTCLSALKYGEPSGDDFIKEHLNNSKGCGGVMRVAPLALNYNWPDIAKLDMEGAQIAAITHGHSLGYMPAAVLTHIINRIVYSEKEMSLRGIVEEAERTAEELFRGDKHLKKLTGLIDLAAELAENDDTDLSNIHRLGEGWVAEETLAISIYCALRYQDDFSAGIIAAVNHKGDSDSTGAVTGNILGALLGYDAIDEKWKTNLELMDVILEMADDICRGCQMSEYSDYEDPDWLRKYTGMRWKPESLSSADEDIDMQAE